MMKSGLLERDSIYAYLGAISLLGHSLVIVFALISPSIPFITAHSDPTSMAELVAKSEAEKRAVLAEFPTENKYERLEAIKARIEEREKAAAALEKAIAAEPSRREKVKKQERRRANERVLRILRKEELNVMADITARDESH